jgi:peptidoglycan/xylan/chitin deacetylase (PgdA/CDA1 family)
MRGLHMHKGILVSAAAALLASCATPRQAPALEIALTVDDLPVHAPFPPGVTANEVNDQMVAALGAAHVPATGFVNGIGVERHPETIQALRDWRAADLLLGSHTWSHPHLSEITLAQFDEELSKGEPMLKQLGGNTDWRWFRYPFLDEGKDEAQRIAARRILASHGYKVAGVTIGFGDWAFTGTWARCNTAGNKAAVAELERMYLDAARQGISVARGTAHALYGRDIPYVLLMHVSAMSAHMMPRVIQLYRDAGFRFVSIQQAESDPVYRAYTDLSLAPPTPDWKLAQEKHVTLPQATDLQPKLNAMCPAPASKPGA